MALLFCSTLRLNSVKVSLIVLRTSASDALHDNPQRACQHWVVIPVAVAREH